MKVYIGPYDHWFRPATWLERLILWAYGFGKKCDWEKLREKKGEDAWEQYDALRDWIHDQWWWKALYVPERWVRDNTERAIKIRIDPYDTWGLDDTLALIALPMLKQLRATKQGSPYVDDADVPDELKSTAAPPLTEEQSNMGVTDDNFHKRWEWVMDEMIWAFEQMNDPDAEDKFHYDLDPAKPRMAPGLSFQEMMRRGGYDKEGHVAWQERKTRGLTLFGKYFEALWD